MNIFNIILLSSQFYYATSFKLANGNVQLATAFCQQPILNMPTKLNWHGTMVKGIDSSY